MLHYIVLCCVERCGVSTVFVLYCIVLYCVELYFVSVQLLIAINYNALYCTVSLYCLVLYELYYTVLCQGEHRLNSDPISL